MLSLLSYLYGKVIDLRNFAYDRGIFESRSLRARTISIGNITTGGTGKTPLTAYVAKLLLDRGEKVCILTRGYGRDDQKQRVLVSDGESILETDPKKAGDEPVELANKLEGRVVIIADADRVTAAEWAKRKFGVTAFVLDDGFQHRRAKRDVDIVCVDATDPFGAGKMLPAGRLREGISSLARAAAIVITRAELVAEQALSDLKSELARIAPEAALFECRSCVTQLTPIAALAERRELSQGEKAFAFCGVGNPESFFSLLRSEGFVVAGTHAFADHYTYSQKDITFITGKAQAHEASVLLTTHKDAVKLRELELVMPCYIIGMDVEVSDSDGFSRLL